MEKRLIHALVLSLLFMFAYQAFFGPEPEEQAAPAVATGDNVPPTADRMVAGGLGAQAQREAEQDAAAAELSQAPERTIAFEGRDFSSLWQSRGAALSTMHLLNYKTSLDDSSPLALLGAVDGDAGNFLMNDLNGRYALDRVHWAIEETTTPAGFTELVFTHDTGQGLVFRRRVLERDTPYSFGLTVEVENTGDAVSDGFTLALQGARGLVDEEAGSQWYGAPTALAVQRIPGGTMEVQRWSGGDLDDEPLSIREARPLVAAGTMVTYFVSALRPGPEVAVSSVTPVAILDTIKLEREVLAQEPRSERDAEAWRTELAADFRTNAAVDLGLTVPRLEPGATHVLEFEVYSGPKSLEVASTPGFGFLTPIIESTYGMLGFINRWLLGILRFFHGIVGNWGVAIILLTILVKGVLFPLNRRQQSSMMRYSQAMQKLKPRLDELKKKYKGNTRKFNEEQMKLLRAEGASPPLGGCLLTFAQFPIWISLFQILGTSIELRQSEFAFWVRDLSRPDAMPFGFFGLATLNLLPILMAGATIVQMRFQPKPADPQQAQMQKIMGTVMPLVMLFVLYGYSAGLSLYIFTSSLIGIFEFQVIRRFWPIPGAPPMGKGAGGDKAGGKPGGKSGGDSGGVKAVGKPA